VQEGGQEQVGKETLGVRAAAQVLEVVAVLEARVHPVRAVLEALAVLERFLTLPVQLTVVAVAVEARVQAALVGLAAVDGEHLLKPPERLTQAVAVVVEMTVVTPEGPVVLEL
jgi:hypothetical protein